LEGMLQRMLTKIKSNIKYIGDTRLWLVFLILLPWIVNTVRNPNNDYGTVANVVRDWVAGRTALYASGSVYYNYTPWMLGVYTPLSFIPHPFGQLIFNITSLCLLIWSTWYLVKPIKWSALALSLTTIYTGMLIHQGQWDAFVLASLTLGWIGYQRKNPWLVGVAIVGVTTKFTNVIIPTCLLIISIRIWPIKSIFKVAILPLITLGLSFLIVGWDWPLRYFRLLKLTVEYFRSYEVTTIFSKAEYPVSYRLILQPLGYIVIILLAVVSLYLLFRLSRRGLNVESINLALALNLVASPYFTFHHIIYLCPTQAYLLKNQKIWGVILFGASIIDLLLLYMGIGLIIYPLVALLILIIISLVNLHHSDSNLLNRASYPQ
jgi:hypothetical protein